MPLSDHNVERMAKIKAGTDWVANKIVTLRTFRMEELAIFSAETVQGSHIERKNAGATN